MEQFRYLAFAEQEALLRFPNAPQVEKWRWDLCYNLALSNQYAESDDAPELGCYAELIENSLNSRNTDLTGLPNWFTTHESRFSFEITSHIPPPGYTSSYVISLDASANLWLLEKEGTFQVFGLRSSMFFFRESGSKFQLLDLTGDEYPELVLYFSRATCCNSFSQQFIYELSSGTPKLLSLEDLNGISTHTISEYESNITVLDSKNEPPGFLFEGHYGNDAITQPCTLREYDKYYWKGTQFELVDTWFGIDQPGKYDDKEFCQFVIDTARDSGELEIAVKTIGDRRITEPDVTRDQILYRLGEYQARVGNIEKATEYLTTAVSLQPADKPASKWGKDAQVFLDSLEGGNRYYGICTKVAECSMRDALQQLILETQPDSFLSISELLKSSGVSIKSNGFVNFDAKDNIEQWLVIQPLHKADREFWILVQHPEKIYGLFVVTIPTNRPNLKEFAGSNEYLLTTSDGESLISLESLGFSQQPYVTTHASVENRDSLFENDYLNSYLIEEPLDHIANQLVSGVDPEAVQKKLVQLTQSNAFRCDKLSLCDTVDYLKGLTSELMGDSDSAIQTYVQLWKEYPSSFYTIMARSKLENP